MDARKAKARAEDAFPRAVEEQRSRWNHSGQDLHVICACGWKTKGEWRWGEDARVGAGRICPIGVFETKESHHIFRKDAVEQSCLSKGLDLYIIQHLYMRRRKEKNGICRTTHGFRASLFTTCLCDTPC